jgi:uncharacterized protein YggE
MLKKIVLAVALLPLAVHATNLPDYPFIHASGEGFLMVVPDMGEIYFDLSAYDPDPAAAVALIQARAEAIRAMLTEQSGAPGSEGAAGVEIREMRKEMRKSATPNPDPNAAPEYEMRSSVQIVVRDLGKWRPIMQALLEMKNIDHMSTMFGRSDRLKAEQELTATAVKDAQRRAETMAAGFGKHAGAVTAISSGQLRNLTNAVGLMPTDLYNDRKGTAASSEEKDFLSIQVLRWSQTVDMIFRIK